MIFFLCAIALGLVFCLIFFLAEGLLERKYSLKRTVFCLLLLTAGMVWMKLSNIFPTTFVSLFTGCAGLFFLIFFYRGRLDQILYVLVGYSFVSILANYLYLIPVFLFWDPDILTELNWQDGKTLLTTSSIGVLSYLLGYCFVRVSKKYIYRYSFGIVLGLFFFVQLFLIALQPGIEVAMGYAEKMAVGPILPPVLLILTDLAFFIAFGVEEHRRKLEDTLLQTESLKQMEEDYYRNVSGYRNDKEELYGLLIHRIAGLEEALKEHDRSLAKEALDAMRSDTAKTKQKKLCENSIVNAVLTEKKKECEGLSITFKERVQIQEEISVLPIHLCNLYSNLLDNALRASRDMPEGKRWIRIESKAEEGYLLIRMENTALAERTEPRARHGYGMRIIQDITNTYDGTFTHAFQGGIYTTNVMLIYWN